MNFKKILIIIINFVCLWMALKIILNYYTEYQEKKTENPIECVVTEKDCKYSRATSHCNLLYQGKIHRVQINNCESLTIGKNNTDFYYNKVLGYVFDKDYIEIKFLVAIPLIFVLVIFFTVKNWGKI